MTISNERLITLLRGAAAAETAKLTQDIDLDGAFQEVMEAPLDSGKSGSEGTPVVLAFRRGEEQRGEGQRPSYFLSAPEHQQGQAAESARKVGEVRRLVPVLAPGTTWQHGELTWEETVAGAELLISEDRNHAAVRLTGIPSYWGFKAEVLPQPDDRPHHPDDLQSIAEQEPDGIVSLVMPEDMSPDAIRRIALHVLENGLNPVGSVVFQVGL